MKLIIALAALVALAVAAPQQDPKVPQIVRSDFDQKPEGGYSYAFETEDKIQKEETGEVKDVVDEDNKPQQVVVVRGSYSYVDQEGKPHTVTYFADETGFHAESVDIPTVPVGRR